jgi:hypothetical protein
MTLSRLRSTAAKKMSLRVAMVIASFGARRKNRAPDLWELYCFLDAFGNVKPASHRYPSCFVVTSVRQLSTATEVWVAALRPVYYNRSGRLS